MILQSLIRVCLVVVLVWQVSVHWSLYVRGWAGWEQLRKRKRRKRSSKEKKPKPFEGLTRQPVCEMCVAETEKQGEENGTADGCYGCRYH